MTWWQTLITTAVPTVVAPLALYFQQRLQNQRESEREARALEAQREAAKDARISQLLEERRAAYANVIRAAHKYRASRAPEIARIAAQVKQPGSVVRDVLRSRWPPVPAALGEFQEALGTAWVWAAGSDLERQLEMLQDLLDQVESYFVPEGSDRSCGEAFSEWSDFGSRLAIMARIAAEDFDARLSALDLPASEQAQST